MQKKKVGGTGVCLFLIYLLAGVLASLTKILARSRLKWAGHVERMGDGQLAKRAQKMEGNRKQGKPRM